MRRLLLVAAGLVALTHRAEATEITIELPGEVAVERVKVSYDCGGNSMSVDYVNAGPVSLAVFEHEGEPVIAAAGLSASGVRYVGGRLVWWTKGPEASLYDATKGENAAPIAECREQS
ncbi:MliC family protein [Chelativorans sp. AA-79]|uniref:MliC family protein n=1 Tax=Chelativorans sp. AA-79 TaxID=3028735 RepID=UPI0023FA40FA|nr:MliC family protein [Chelativorans sp. AA-79]WEX10098.1 MliC family protein [Chelativorans sp. AA-79]